MEKVVFKNSFFFFTVDAQPILCNIKELKEEEYKDANGEAKVRYIDQPCNEETKDQQAGVCE